MQIMQIVSVFNMIIKKKIFMLQGFFFLVFYSTIALLSCKTNMIIHSINFRDFIFIFRIIIVKSNNKIYMKFYKDIF